MTFDVLRHPRATMLLSSGVPMAVVSKMLGHSSIQLTVNTYGHLLDEAAVDAAQRADVFMTRPRALPQQISLASGPIRCARTHPAKQNCRSREWGGRDSNPRPRDYECDGRGSALVRCSTSLQVTASCRPSRTGLDRPERRPVATTLAPREGENYGRGRSRDRAIAEALSGFAEATVVPLRKRVQGEALPSDQASALQQPSGSWWTPYLEARKAVHGLVVSRLRTRVAARDGCRSSWLQGPGV